MRQIRFRFVPLIAAAAMLAAGCRPVEEISPDNDSVTVIAPASETVTVSLTETISETEVNFVTETSTETSSEDEVMEATETDSDTQTSSKTETSSVMEAAETTVSLQRLRYETTRTSDETKPTLQYESPPETESEVQTVAMPRVMGTNSYSALNFKEQKGFWITYLEYGTILRGKSEKSFKKSIGEYFDNIAELGFNTVYVQVRAFGDAYYDSELFPSGEQFNGTIGTKNSFDALQVMVDCAHDRGLSIHAWVNPMRLMTPRQIENIDDGYAIKKWYKSSKYNGKYIVKSGDRLYLNPAYGEVTDLIAEGISEIVSNYKVDGIQIDDYFYPTTDKSFDKAAYKASGTKLSLSQWRTENVNKMVKKLYKAVHSGGSSVVFGISPQGSVENNCSELYADVKAWCAEDGYCDYILPQVYFGFESAALPYSDVIKQWNDMVKGSDVKLVIGLAAYKIGAEDKWAGSGKREWINDSDIIARQMAEAKALGNYGGVAIYRYDSLFNPEPGVAKQVNKELKNIEK